MATDGLRPAPPSPRAGRADQGPRAEAVSDREEAALIESLSAIRRQLLEQADGWRPWNTGTDSDRDASARNLLQYLALRGHDLRALQDRLVALGLSSLGRSEGHVQASIDAVLAALDALVRHPPAPSSSPAPIGFSDSRELLSARTAALLGPVPQRRLTRIMVTLPTEAAGDANFVREVLLAGMDCARINCAHDSAPEWRSMLENLRAADDHAQRRTRVLVDLPGPKLRTGGLGPHPKSDRKGAYLRLRVGDRLLLTPEAGPRAAHSRQDSPAWVGCSLTEAFAVTRPGHRVWFDDGKLGAVAESVDSGSIELRITEAGAKGSKLRADKGINLPDAALDVDLLGSHSEEALRFAAECADIVGLSFVSHPREVERIHEYLDRHARGSVGIVLKIETRRAVERLPGLLLAALGGDRPAGVMIARGDLAVECGYERLAEAQEEIMWLCQAAHLPVIWATQVLDRLAKTGRPSRAEITDAAMGVRAECVMLNKGPQILEAIAVLDEILSRMKRHQHKKRALLPRLVVSDYHPTLG